MLASGACLTLRQQSLWHQSLCSPVVLASLTAENTPRDRSCNGIVTSIISVYYYLKVVVAMAAVVAIALFFTLQLGLLPSLYLNMTQFPVVQALVK